VISATSELNEIKYEAEVGVTLQKEKIKIKIRNRRGGKREFLVMAFEFLFILTVTHFMSASIKEKSPQ